MNFVGAVASISVAGTLLLCATQTGWTQDQGASVSPPQGIPPEIASQFNNSSGASVAPPEPVPPAAATLTGSNYIYDTLRVITKNASRGCNSSDWNCMANLCKQDLGQTAWRGWAGCHAHNNDFICYFECSQAKQTF